MGRMCFIASLLQEHLSSDDVMQGSDSPFQFDQFCFYLQHVFHDSVLVSRPRQYFGFVSVFQMKLMLMKERLQRLDVLMFLYFTMACFDLWRIYTFMFEVTFYLKKKIEVYIYFWFF